MPELETIITERTGGVGRLILNRPDSLNAFNETMTGEMLAALRDFSRDAGVRCVAVTGRGRAFSAGQDLKEVAPGHSFRDSLDRRYNQVVKVIAGMPKPVVALVNGIAAGAGMGLAVACDFRIAAVSARFVPAFIRIGLVPDTGLTYFLPRLLGYSKAYELAALGDEVSSSQALEIGLVNRVVPDGEFDAEAGKILERFAAGPTKTFPLIRRLLNRSAVSSLEETLEYESLVQEIAGRTEDSREAIRSFIEKRSPVFRGK